MVLPFRRLGKAKSSTELVLVLSRLCQDINAVFLFSSCNESAQVLDLIRQLAEKNTAGGVFESPARRQCCNCLLGLEEDGRGERAAEDHVSHVMGEFRHDRHSDIGAQ